MWLPTLACLFIVRHFTNQPGALDAGTVGGMFLGIFLAGCMFLSLGCFASAISRTQMVAAIISLVPNVSLFILAYLALQIPAAGNWQTQVLSHFALFGQMQDFTRGVVDTRVVIFYLSITFFFLFLTLRVVESRRWR
jgi:ABC-2 type transport system permease protein